MIFGRSTQGPAGLLQQTCLSITVLACVRRCAGSGIGIREYHLLREYTFLRKGEQINVMDGMGNIGVG